MSLSHLFRVQRVRASRAGESSRAQVVVEVVALVLDFVETRQGCVIQLAQLLASCHRFHSLLPSYCWRAETSLCRANSRLVAAAQGSSVCAAVVWRMGVFVFVA